MPRRKIDALDTPELELPALSSGAVCEVLGIEPRRLHNYVEGRAYGLLPSGCIGRGRGHRHWFSVEDVYRLGIAHQMFKDGFAAGIISRLLEGIDDRDFFELDQSGLVPHPVVAFRRGKEETEFELFQRNRVPAVRVGGPHYYLLDVASIVGQIDQKMAARGLKVK